MSELSSPSPKFDQSGSSKSTTDNDERGTFRALVEAFVSLFVAVLIFRTFAAEGYMISTGSMAPCLLGFHKRVICPTCHVTFSFGTAYDTDEDPDNESLAANRSRAVCPNCGQQGIDVTDVPRNHGDQLLVNKQAYLYKLPERWDVVVFRNPAHPTEAYVKRAVGLPGERIQIVHGDVVIDGLIARKSYRQQVATRILVHDHNYRPVVDDGFRSHWQIVDSEVAGARKHQPLSWNDVNSSFVFKGADKRRADRDPVAWVEYHHWIRSGGNHDSTVPLASWPDDVTVSSVPPAGLRYDPNKGEFSVTGAIPRQIARQLLELTENETFRNAVRELYEASHIIAVTDEYGYNPPDEAGPPNSVRDLMFSAKVSLQSGAGEFIIEMTDGSTVFSVIFDVIRGTINVYAKPLGEGMTLNSQPSDDDTRSEPVASVRCPDLLSNHGALVEVSLIDKQLLVAVDGKSVMDPWPFELSNDAQAPRIPVRFGARGVDMTVSNLKLYRDIFYTETRSRHGVSRPYELRGDEFFVLGDNSPVSHDSRRWEQPAVHQTHLIGKPFLVHLPSKPANLRIGNREMRLRIPDWERIRLLK